MAEEQKRTKQRSPNYPGVGLELALEKAAALLEAEGPNFAASNVAIADMGYAPKSGPGTTTLAALKKFGLIEEDGRGSTRRVKVSDLARSILLDERPGSPERAALLRRAALTPPLHQAIWDRYPEGLPSDAQVRFDLQKDGFTRSGADDFLRQFKSTMQYAGVKNSATIADEEEAETDEELDGDVDTELLERPGSGPKPPGGSRTFTLPISRNESAILRLPANLDESGWAQMMKFLDVMKESLLSEPEVPSAD